MIRRQARLRREFLYRKSAEIKHSKIQEKKNKIKDSLENNHQIETDLQKNALVLQDKLKWDSSISNINNEELDDEYRFAGCEDPKVMITTSHNPSARLKMFAKEMRLIFPNAQRINRGNHEMKQLMQACRANDVTDFIIIHENRGVPNNIVITHLPYGPTAFFSISDVVMRHDVTDVGPMSEQKPHLIFHNFKTKLGIRTKTILKHLFPVPKSDSKRVLTFANHDDYISFRHHTYVYEEKQLKLTEVGPRFQMKLYKIKLGALDELDAADTEWILRPYMNTAVKRRFLSDDDGWNQEDDDLE
ncbi:U3 small nucleolar ribonucleoprotein protein IMP4 [Condylostylus longicornis]|uniref:U3 small nucleolar ribonucleoprotein protein IMP4 n=1 Tax=Condylostylus longicornis TaxID=2530218 RepID=UPI00244DD5BC|nr:U3 small nucleolar ribonucleoprotein protein IMP4 [Condylostylus longicornis]